jgi:DNA-binding MarR family transcriptional regulator
MESTDEFDLEAADRLRRSVGDIVRAVRAVTDARPDNQLETLGYLMRGGPHSIAALARLRRIRHQSMSAIVAELVSQGLVERSPDPGDARGVLIALTGAGSRVVTESRETRATLLLGVAELELDDAERALLARVPPLLDRLSAALEGAALPGSPLPGQPLPGSALPGSELPGSALPGSALPGPPLPGSPLPGSPLPGSPLPGSALPGSALPGSPLPGQPLPGSPLPGSPLPGEPLPGEPG